MSERSELSIDVETRIADHFPNAEPIAVIGHACRFPEAPDSEAFWRAIVAGQVCSRRFARGTAGLFAERTGDNRFAQAVKYAGMFVAAG